MKGKEAIQNTVGNYELNRVTFSNTEVRVFFRHNINKYRSVSISSGCQSVEYHTILN